MKDYLWIGSVPYDEECAQVGTEDYDRLSRKESKAFIGQLWRVLKEKFNVEYPLEGFDIVVKSEYHDFGIYKEVVLKFDGDNDQLVSLAYKLEESIPAHWDEIALQELRK